MWWENKAVIISAVALGLAAISARAATVGIQFVNVNPLGYEQVSTDSGAHYSNTETGQFNFNVITNNDGAQSVISGPTLSAWCIELDQYTSTQTSTYNVLDPTLGLGSYVAPPFNNSTLVEALFDHFYSPSFTTDQAVAFQLDIWELTMDTSWGNLSTGTFRVMPGDNAYTIANGWLAQLALNPNPTGEYSIVQLNSDSLQDEIFPVLNGGSPPPTPLPAALPSAVALLAGLAIFRKLRRKSPV